MNEIQRGLLNLVDIVDDTGHLGVGDMICHEGKWKKILRIEKKKSYSEIYVEEYYDDGHGPYENSIYDIYKGNGVPRIPRPIIDLLKLSTTMHPYR